VPPVAYQVTHVRVRDRAKLVEYGRGVLPILESYGGRLLGMSFPSLEVIEGEWRPELLFVHRWPNREAFHAFYSSEEYRPWLKLRLEATDSELVIFDGLEEPAEALDQSGTAVIRDLFAAVQARDLDRVLAAYDEDAVIREFGSLPHCGTHRGRDEIGAAAMRWARTWLRHQGPAERPLEPEFMRCSDASVVVRWRLKARAGDSVLRLDVVDVYRLRGGKIVEADIFYSDTAQALKFLAAEQS
jgi:uncharacterized protein (DUF1330 family)/ketosteroid isomerase-like protein